MAGNKSVLTESINQPQHQADILIYQTNTNSTNGDVVKYSIQFKNIENVTNRVNKLSMLKYQDMVLAIPRDQLEETKEFLEIRKSRVIDVEKNEATSNFAGPQNVMDRLLLENNVFRCDVPTSGETMYATLNSVSYVIKRYWRVLWDELLVDVFQTLFIDFIDDMVDVFYFHSENVEEKVFRFFTKKIFKVALLSTFSCIAKYIMIFYFGESLPHLLTNIGIWKCVFSSVYQVMKLRSCAASTETEITKLDEMTPLFQNISSYLGCYLSLKIYPNFMFGVIGSFISNISTNYLINGIKLGNIRINLPLPKYFQQSSGEDGSDGE